MRTRWKVLLGVSVLSLFIAIGFFIPSAEDVIKPDSEIEPDIPLYTARIEIISTEILDKCGEKIIDHPFLFFVLNVTVWNDGNRNLTPDRIDWWLTVLDGRNRILVNPEKDCYSIPFIESDTSSSFQLIFHLYFSPRNYQLYLQLPNMEVVST